MELLSVERNGKPLADHRNSFGVTAAGQAASTSRTNLSTVTATAIIGQRPPTRMLTLGGGGATDLPFPAGFPVTGDPMETAIELEAPPVSVHTEFAAIRSGRAPTREPVRMIEYFETRTSLGATLVAVTENGVCALLLGDREEDLRADLAARFPARRLQAVDEPDMRIKDALARVEGTAGNSAVPPLDMKGTEFEKAVWTALLEITAGQTVTYSEIAARIGRPTSVRAVARACGANPVAVVVPCHRVLRSDGSISGYRWGVERKRALLDREGAAFTR